jgi:hypothetical protein
MLGTPRIFTMMPDTYYEIRDLKNQLKDLRAQREHLINILLTYDAGIIRDEKELIDRLRKELIKK